MLRRRWIQSLALAAAAALVAGGASAAEEAKQPAKAGEGSEAEKARTAASPLEQPVLIASNMPVFVPPNRGAPPMRLGGATRSAKAAARLPRIEALVPEEPGWTLESQPVLYWFLAETTQVPIEFGVQRVDPLQDVVKKRLATPARAGVQRIRLADHGARLEPGAVYFWYVKLVPDANDPEQDRLVGGGIQRVPAPAGLQAQLADPQTSRPHALAQAGVWYDAMDAYSSAIEARPADAALREQRAALLRQVDIEIE
jgi:hypothetical protein